MDPFVHLAEFFLVVCTRCQFACVADEVQSHLRDRHPEVSAERRARIAEAVVSIPNIIRSQEDLARLPYPTPTHAPIPYIKPPQTNGLGCKECSFVVRTKTRIKKHCREDHGWQNPNKRGRTRKPKDAKEPEGPWAEGIQCQQFFPSRGGRRWFEVGRGVGHSGPAPVETTAERIARIIIEQAAQIETWRRRVEAEDGKGEPGGWLARTGWAAHLHMLDGARLRSTIDPIRDDEVVLRAMWARFQQTAERARRTAIRRRVGIATLFEINRTEADVKPKMPFDSRMEKDTWGRYCETMRKLISFAHRTRTQDEDERPSYQLTASQRTLFSGWADAEEQAMAGGSQVRQGPIDRLCVDTVVAMFDHEFKDSEYENVAISGLAVMGMRGDGGWAAATEYTTVYSAVIKMVRMLVVYQARIEQAEYTANIVQAARASGQTMTIDEARQRTPGMLSWVRPKVQRFMTQTTRRSGPTPMDWIFDTRRYGMRIRFTTAAMPVIDWDGDLLMYQQIKVRTSQLADMFHEAIEEARGMLATLLMGGKDDPTTFPPIDWAQIHDDHSEERVGYSFLTDDRNVWAVDGAGWVARRMAARPDWIEGDGTGAMPFRPAAVRAYETQFNKFRAMLLMLMHMLGGQPARAPEILGIRYANTANGGLRNIFIHKGMVCFVTMYHKNFRSTGEAKIIHRYVPREVGSLLVWYLWLVLPFWQAVQGIIHDTRTASAFLWAESVVRQEERAEDGESEGDEAATETIYDAVVGGDEEDEMAVKDEDETPIPAGWIEERRLTSDRMRRTMQECSERHVGGRIGISAWRQMAIAITNKYLSGMTKTTKAWPITYGICSPGTAYTWPA